jgi:hypothetical protein
MRCGKTRATIEPERKVLDLGPELRRWMRMAANSAHVSGNVIRSIQSGIPGEVRLADATTLIRYPA